MTAAEAFLRAVAATSVFYAERGSTIAGVIARRAPACGTLDEYDRLLAPALVEYGDDVPEPLRLLMLDRPVVPCVS